MMNWTSRRRRLTILLVAAAATMLAVGLTLLRGQDAGRSGARAADSGASSSAAPSSSDRTSDTSSNDALAPNAETDVEESQRAAIRFATRAARMLFDWDARIDDRESVTQGLLDVADPTGVETPGLLGDLDMHLPGPERWEELRRYEARQWVEVDHAEIPATWHKTLDSAEADELMPGTWAVNLTGALYREGVINGRREESRRLLRFTMFVTCAPSYDECRLLRLGIPGKILE